MERTDGWDGGVDGGMCRQSGSKGMMYWSHGWEWSSVQVLPLDSGSAGTPAVHTGSRGGTGSDSAGSRVLGFGGKRGESIQTERREGGVCSDFGSL